MKNKNQRGIALAVTLMVLLILVVVAVSIGSIGVFNLRHVNNYRDSMKAYYAARAGVTDAIDQLRATPTATPTPTPSPTVTLTNNTAYTFNFVGSGKYDSTTNINGTSGTITRTSDYVDVPEGYAYIIGTGVCLNQVGTVTATRRVAAMVKGATGGIPWDYALFGYEYLKTHGSGDITGKVGTNGKASDNAMDIGNPLKISEFVGPPVVTAPYSDYCELGESKPEVELPYSVAGTTNIKTTTSKSSGNYGYIRLSSSETLTLSAGTYQFTDIQVTAGATINISSGPVYIYFTGNLNLGGNSITNTTSNAANCIFYSTSTDTSSGLSFDGGASGYFAIYAPDALVKFTGNYDFYGSAIGKEADCGGTAKIVYDSNLNDLVSTTSDYLDSITWQNVY